MTNNHGGFRPGAGNFSSWGRGPTKSVRVPEKFANREVLQRYLLDLPEALDNLLEELDPRKTSPRAELAYEKLAYLKSLLAD